MDTPVGCTVPVGNALGVLTHHLGNIYLQPTIHRKVLKTLATTHEGKA